MTNDHDLGNTTAITCERRRDLTELIVINGKRRANEVYRRILVAEVDHEVGVQLKDREGNTNMGEKRRNGRTGIAIGMEWTTGLPGTKDVIMEDTGDDTR